MYQREFIYSTIAEQLSGQYPNLYVAQVRELIPREVPCCFIELISKSRTRRYATLDNTDDQYRMRFEVQVFSKDMIEANEIMDFVGECFKSLSFFQNTYRVEEEGSVHRLIARFSAQVGGTV